jgi:hypothetical protein
MDTAVGIDTNGTAMFTVNVRTTAAAIAIQTTLVPSDRVSLCGSLAGSHLEFHHGCECIVIVLLGLCDWDYVVVGKTTILIVCCYWHPSRSTASFYLIVYQVSVSPSVYRIVRVPGSYDRYPPGLSTPTDCTKDSEKQTEQGARFRVIVEP